jgi:hypothetical protein
MEIWNWITDQDLYESNDSGGYPFSSLPAPEDPDWVETWASTVNRSAALNSHERRATDSSKNEVPFDAMVEDEEQGLGLTDRAG